MIRFQDFIYPDFSDGIFLEDIPSWDIQDGILRAWWIDPLVATLAFGVFIRWYWYHEHRLGLNCNRDDRLLFSLAGGSYWIGIYLWKMIVPPASNVIPDGVPTSLSEFIYLGTEVATGIVLYDAAFFFIHWAMHDVPMLRRIHHMHHHRPNGTLEARDVLRHSFLDGALQVLVNIMVQRFTPWGLVKSRLARAIHNVLVIWMLTESHTSSPEPYIWRRWFVGIRDHRLHHFGTHARESYHGKHHRYQQFFGYLDDLRAVATEYRLKLQIERTKRL